MHQHEGFSQKKISQKMFTLFSSVQLRRLNGFEQRCHKAALQKSASYHSDRHNQNSSLARIRTKQNQKKMILKKKMIINYIMKERKNIFFK